MGKIVYLLYTNYKNETAWRRIHFSHTWVGKTLFHPEEQYLFSAYDIDKKADRDFAMAGIRKWQYQPPVGVVFGRQEAEDGTPRP